MTTKVCLLNIHHHTWLQFFSLEMRTFKLNSLGNFQVYNTVSLGLPCWSSGDDSAYLRDVGLVPGWGTKIPHALRHDQTKPNQKISPHPAGKESACNAGDLALIPGLGRFPWEGKGYPLQYFGLEVYQFLPNSTVSFSHHDVHDIPRNYLFHN